MDAKREEEIVEMFDGGVGTAGIAEEMGVSVTAVRNILQKYGRDTSGPRILPKEDEIVEEYTRGDPAPVILNKHRITYSQLYGVLSRHNIPTRRISETEARVKRLDTAVEMYLAGAKLWEILNETGIAQPTLHAEIHKRGLPLRRASTGAGDRVDSQRAREGSTSAVKMKPFTMRVSHRPRGGTEGEENE